MANASHRKSRTRRRVRRLSKEEKEALKKGPESNAKAGWIPRWGYRNGQDPRTYLMDPEDD